MGKSVQWLQLMSFWKIALHNQSQVTAVTCSL